MSNRIARVECHIFSGLMGELTNKGTTILEKMIDDLPQVVDAHHHSHRKWEEVAEGIIARHGKLAPALTILIGHSYGALRCQQIAFRMNEHGIPIEYIAGIDPTALKVNHPPMLIPENVAQVDEFHAARGVPATRRKTDPSGQTGGMYIFGDNHRTVHNLFHVNTAHIASASAGLTQVRIIGEVRRLLDVVDVAGANRNEGVAVETTIHSINSMPKASLETAGIVDAQLHSDDAYETWREKNDPKESSNQEAFVEATSSWRVAKSLLALREQINNHAPDRSKKSDGTIGDERHCGKPGSTSDHCPHIRKAGVGIVSAMDVTHDADKGCDADAIAESLRLGEDRRIKYVIWNRRIFSSYSFNGNKAWTWRKYGGSNPHTKHVHISVAADSDLYDSQLAWNLYLPNPVA